MTNAPLSFSSPRSLYQRFVSQSLNVAQTFHISTPIHEIEYSEIGGNSVALKVN